MPSQPALSTNAEEPLGKMNKTKPRKLGPTRLLTRKAFGQSKKKLILSQSCTEQLFSLPSPNFRLQKHQRHPPPHPHHGSVYKTLTNARGKANVRAGTCNPQ